MSTQTEILKGHLENIDDPVSEAFVRDVIANSARVCPLDILEGLGEVLLLPPVHGLLGRWKCSSCHKGNSARRTTCRHCGAAKS